MNEELLALIRTEIKNAVKETVNGKIDALSKKLDNHILTVEPILQGLAVSKVAIRIVTTIGGVLIGIGAIYTFARKIFP